MSISAAMLPEFDQEMATTRRVLERIPDDKLSYKPHPKSFSSAQLASHITEMVGWLEPTIAYDSFDMNPPDGPKYQPWVATSSAELVKKFDANVAAARAGLEGATNEQMMVMWSLKNAGSTLFSMPRAACIRGMIFNHIIHHRGQLSLYLRLNDIPVPALYGPSADEGKM